MSQQPEELFPGTCTTPATSSARTMKAPSPTSLGTATKTMHSPSPTKLRTQFDLDHFLKKHLRFTKKRIRYEKEELLALINRAQFELQMEGSSILVEINCLPINIVGDLHGQWRDLLRIFNALGVPGDARYLFLGDYIDRGSRSLECISLLLALKIKFRTKVYLLRGNHECDYINYNYGFFEELKRRFHLGDALELFKAFNLLFNYFPLVALVVERVLCMHGGISPELKSIDQLRKVRLPTKVLPNAGLTLDLLWSDPMPNTKGFVHNQVRDCSYCFGADAAMKICNKLNIDMIVRAHQALGNGFGFFARQHMVTIFSAPRYLRPELNSMGAVLRINSQYEFSVMLLNPTTEETRGKFVEQFNLASRMSAMAFDELTVIEKMPKDRIEMSQMSEESEEGKGTNSKQSKAEKKRIEAETKQIKAETKKIEMETKLMEADAKRQIVAERMMKTNPGGQQQTMNSSQKSMAKQPKTSNSQMSMSKQSKTSNSQMSMAKKQPKTSNSQMSMSKQPKTSNSQMSMAKQPKTSNSQMSMAKQPKTNKSQMSKAKQPKTNKSQMSKAKPKKGGKSGMAAKSKAGPKRQKPKGKKGKKK